MQGLQGGGKGAFLQFAGLARGRNGAFLGFAGLARGRKGSFLGLARAASEEKGVLFDCFTGCKLPARVLFHSLHELQTLCEGPFSLFARAASSL